MNSFVLTLIRLAFSVASKLTPKLAGRAAFRLFCTTFKATKTSAKGKSILDTAKLQFSAATRHNVAYTGGNVAAFEFIASGNVANKAVPKTAWLVHGWQSNALFMSKFIAPLQAHGYRVIAIDLPGHGQSSGRTFNLALAVSAFHAVRDALGEFDAVVSHSLGGAAVATTLAGTLPDFPTLPVQKLVMISSPNSMVKIFDDFSKMVGLGANANKELHEMVTKLSGKKTEDFTIGTQLQSVSKKLLLMHAPDDKEVPYSEAEAIALANPESVLKPIAGLGHRRIIASADVVATAVEFIRS